MRLRTSLLLLVIIAWAAAQATAQDVETDALIDQGVSLREQGRDAEARDLFDRAYQLSQSARALAQLALAEQALGEWVNAYTHLTDALAAGGAWIQERRQPLEASLARITEHIGHLELVDGVVGAEVRVNGEPIGVLPLSEAIPILAGTVVLEIRATGHEPLRRTFELRAGSRARERVTLVATGSTTTTDRPGATRTTGGSDGLISGAIGAFVVAGAGLVTMAIFGGLTATEHSELAARCGMTRSCTPADVADANTFALVSDISLGVGLAAAAIGAILLAVGLSAGTAAEAEAFLVPWVSPDSVGATARTRF